jgi:hypothetical protein
VKNKKRKALRGERCHVQWSTTDAAVPCQGGERRSLGADVAGATVARRLETLDMSKAGERCLGL